MRLSPEVRDSLARIDSIARADSIAYAESLHQGIILIAPPGSEAEEVAETKMPLSAVASWLTVVMALLFCIAGVRYKSDWRFLRRLARQMVEIRRRNNMFDETVRETAFTLLTMLLGALSFGMLLYEFLTLSGVASSGGMSLLMSTVCAVGYVVLMPLLYGCFGRVFLGSSMSAEWRKGFSAGFSLLSFMAFPAALAAYWWTSAAEPALWCIGICFGIVKLCFIGRSLKIFMTESSSWVLFLYYLCNLEIVPLVVTYVGAIWLSALFA